MASDAAGPNFDQPPLDASVEPETRSSLVGKVFDTKSLMLETLAWLIWTALADLLIFRASGLAGPAVFLAMVPLVFWIGSRPAGRWRLVLFCSLCCLIASLRLVWSGGPLVVCVGMMLIPALAMAVSGEIPLVLETIALGIRSPFDGMTRLIHRQARPRDVGGYSVATSPSVALSVGLPVVAAIAFGGIFVFANPDLYTSVMAYVDQFQSRLWDFFSGVSFWEVPFCVAALFVGVGLLRPLQPLVKVGGPAVVGRVRHIGLEHRADRAVAGSRRQVLDVLVIGTDIADVGEGEGDNLAGIGGIGEDFLVAGQGRVEADFGFHNAVGTQTLPLDHGAVGQHQQRGRLFGSPWGGGGAHLALRCPSCRFQA